MPPGVLEGLALQGMEERAAILEHDRENPRERDAGDLSDRILATCPDLEGHEVCP